MSKYKNYIYEIKLNNFYKKFLSFPNQSYGTEYAQVASIVIVIQHFQSNLHETRKYIYVCLAARYMLSSNLQLVFSF